MVVSLISESAESGDPLAVMKFGLIMSGIYIWEFVTTLDFEWSVIRRHRRYRWTIWIYSASRLSGLAVIILALVDYFGTSLINCQAWVTSGWVFGALGGYGLSSILIMLRIFAIWDKSKVIMAISAVIWVNNLGFQIAGIIKIRAEWVPAAKSCAITNVKICRNIYTNLFVSDVILLIIMLAGLLRLRRGGGSFYLTQLLWKQGVIWLVIATAAELPQLLLLVLNVNDTLSLLFVVPSMVAVLIAATRIYRSLMHSASPPVTQLGEPDSPDLQKAKRLVSHTKDSSVAHIPSNRLEVTVHTTHPEEYPMSQTNNYDSYHSSDAQLTDKPHELGSDDDVEGHDEK
ncbi:hypothetical protein BGY98DRAFT_516291 [Russula aff. rugulosa BPL654]|nr:hypothetical protein BGY98DRAFT_516291 [Russula aff. rugulosa BPL654]